MMHFRKLMLLWLAYQIQIKEDNMTKWEITKPSKKEKDEEVCLSLKCQQDQEVGVCLYVWLALTYFVCVSLPVLIFVVDVVASKKETDHLLNLISKKMRRILNKQTKIQ